MERERGIRDIEVDGRHGRIMRAEAAWVLVQWDDDSSTGWIQLTEVTEKATEGFVRELGS